MSTWVHWEGPSPDGPEAIRKLRERVTARQDPSPPIQADAVTTKFRRPGSSPVALAKGGMVALPCYDP